MNRALIFAALCFALSSAFAQDVELKSFTGYAGSGVPAVWSKKSKDATSSAKYHACQSARSKARKSGFTEETGSESLNIPSPRYDEKYGYGISTGAASCTINFIRVVQYDELESPKVEGDKFRESVEQELLKALIPNFPSVKSVAIRAALQQALRTEIGKRFLGVIRTFTPSQRQRAAYRAADELEKTLRGITDPKLEDIERMLGSMANELAGVELAGYEQPSAQYDDVWGSMGVTDNNNKSNSTQQQLDDRLWATSDQPTINEEDFYKKWGGSAEINPANISDEYLREREQLEKQKSQKKSQTTKPPATEPKLRTFKMRIQGKTFLVTNDLPEEFFGEYVGYPDMSDQKQIFVLKKNGGSDFRVIASNGRLKFKWGAVVENGKIAWSKECGSSAYRDKESVALILDGKNETSLGCLYRKFPNLRSKTCGHLIRTNAFYGSHIKDC